MARPVVYDEKVRSRLLDAAAAHVFDHGVETLSVRGVAKAAGTTTAAVYTLFDGRDGLVAALYERAVSRFAASLAGAPRMDDPVEDLVALAIAYRASALADPHGYRVMFGGAVDVMALPREVSLRGADTFAPLLERVRDAQAAGALPRHTDPAEIATSLWANVHGLVHIELALPRPPLSGDPATVFARASTALVRGWATL